MLILVNLYFYAARLLERIKHRDSAQWVVKWWRGCIFPENERVAESITVEDEIRIVDALWMDAELRRKIRVSPGITYLQGY